ncbi:universal stress protein [Kitasatospora sp. NPDC054795]
MDPESTGPEQRDQVVVGVDARRPAEAALEFAFAAAQRHGLPLRAVHATAVPVADRAAGEGTARPGCSPAPSPPGGPRVRASRSSRRRSARLPDCC